MRVNTVSPGFIATPAAEAPVTRLAGELADDRDAALRQLMDALGGTPRAAGPAREVSTGKVVDACRPRHRHQEFLRFLKQVAKAYPRRLHSSATTTPHTNTPG